MDTLKRHAGAPAACIGVESSGRAGPSVTGSESRREGHAEIGTISMERGKRRESSAEVSRHRDLMNSVEIQCGGQPAQGFDERSARIFHAESPPHSREIRDAGEIREDPDSASKRQQWTTNDEMTNDIQDTFPDSSNHSLIRQDETTQDETRRDETRRDRTRHNETRQDETRQVNIYTYTYTIHKHIHKQIRVHILIRKARPPDNCGPIPCFRIK